MCSLYVVCVKETKKICVLYKPSQVPVLEMLWRIGICVLMIVKNANLSWNRMILLNHPPSRLIIKHFFRNSKTVTQSHNEMRKLPWVPIRKRGALSSAQDVFLFTFSQPALLATSSSPHQLHWKSFPYLTSLSCHRVWVSLSNSHCLCCGVHVHVCRCLVVYK